jgi:hypothetical protein
MSNAVDSILKINHERAQIERAVQTIYHHILRDYIAEVNRREVMGNLYNFLKDGDIAIIGKAQLKQYQEIEKTVLSVDLLKVNKNG